MKNQSKNRNVPIALTIAGSDSGGGAGIQADLKTFAALGVHGTSATTCITAQNPRRILGIQSTKTEIVRRQIEAVFDELPPAAVKTGMLYSTEIIRVVVSFFSRSRRPPLVVDPVTIATSGARLLKSSAIAVLREELLPLATLVTPNLDEVAPLVGRKPASVDDMRAAAREIFRRFGCAALVKGGHLRGMREAVDIFHDGERELVLTSPFVKGVHLHGAGCAYSAAVTGYLALGLPLHRAVTMAKEFISQAIARSVRAGHHDVVNSFWQ